jgi:Tfp pilus assembly protein FimV
MGLHVDALRRRARRGEVEARQIARPQGSAWEVFVQDDQVPPLPPDSETRILQQLTPRGIGAGFIAEIADLARRAAEAEAEVRIIRVTSERDARIAQLERDLDLARAELETRPTHVQLEAARQDAARAARDANKTDTSNSPPPPHGWWRWRFW